MPLLAIVHLAIVAYFGVHVIRSGRQIYWLIILFSFPALGALVYFFAEYLPEMRHTRGGRKAVRAVRRIVDPGRGLREAEIEFDRSPTAYNQSRLAAALRAEGRLDEAIEHYQRCASGPYAKDASFLAALAETQAEAGRHADAAATLERLFAAHPEQRAGALALAYAEALAHVGDARARSEFEAAVAAEGSIEARCRYGLYLQRAGDTARARSQFEAVLADAQRGHAHSRDLNRDWISAAREGLRSTQQA
ncbi:MAG TPA: tetratricopeptide repeat protein [Burkholderiaceae bacterium]|nr:tetratricopeptide repeat protein [Burkholderiaceae bacterium]